MALYKSFWLLLGNIYNLGKKSPMKKMKDYTSENTIVIDEKFAANSGI